MAVHTYMPFFLDARNQDINLVVLLFLTFSVLVANPKKLLYTVANPARGLLNREKRTKDKVWQRTPPLSPRYSFGSTRLGVTQVSVRLAPVQDFFDKSTEPMGAASQNSTLAVCDNNFPTLVAFLFSWRCLAASTFYFLHAAMNLRKPSVAVSTHTSASNAVAF